MICDARELVQSGDATSFVAESDEGIDAHGAASGNSAGESGYSHEEDGTGDESDRVHRANLVKLGGENSSGGDCDQRADEDSCDGELESLSKNEAKDCCARGPESDANAE